MFKSINRWGSNFWTLHLVDIVSAAVRSRMMSGIKSGNTKPELFIRKGLHRRGFRFRLHDRKIPGKPDLSFPKYGAVIFVHGCFWHRHNCHLSKIPETNSEFWKQKMEKNRTRDREVRSELFALNIRVCEIWECALRGKLQLQDDEIFSSLSFWLTSKNSELVLEGKSILTHQVPCSK